MVPGEGRTTGKLGEFSIVIYQMGIREGIVTVCT